MLLEQNVTHVTLLGKEHDFNVSINIIEQLLFISIYLLGNSGISVPEPSESRGKNPNSIRSFVSVVCTIDGPLDNMDIRWLFKDQIYNSSTEGRIAILNGTNPDNGNNFTTILINPASYQDNGTYYCEIRDMTDQGANWMSARVDLTLLGKSIMYDSM